MIQKATKRIGVKSKGKLSISFESIASSINVNLNTIKNDENSPSLENIKFEKQLLVGIIMEQLLDGYVNAKPKSVNLVEEDTELDIDDKEIESYLRSEKEVRMLAIISKCQIDDDDNNNSPKFSKKSEKNTRNI